ncbi:sex hormone-binding globulin [Rhineura floridana]|uniref:sex hormone-binding globulin n=1 Tax=Rhineura floridana TaxID=261503 RepID=UPI002AC87870|nr:sex hormone-binding globulin [Rhineura floridana]
MIPIAPWLLLLVVPGAPWTAGEELQGIMGAYLSKHGQCFQSLSGEAGALNLGQRLGDSSPTATLFVDLRTVTSAASSFDFRTFDPEGIIFYGDMSPGVNWFVLALRKGKPEIQIHNTVTNITVSGGSRINDGQWHRIMVKNEGHRVMLEVDGDDHLTLSHVSKAIIDDPVSLMRIGVGGLFIPVQELLLPLNPALDGCMRRWNWLNRSSEWLEGASLEEQGTKVCFPTIHRGSFFPGDGVATFSLSGLPTGLSSANKSWSLAVEMWIRAAPQSGTLLAVSTMKQTLLLCLNLHRTDLMAQLGNKTVLLVPLPTGGCLDAHLLLSITPSHVTLRLGDTETSKPTPKPDFESLKHIWLGQKGHLIFGGLPGHEKSPLAQEGIFFRGCLRGIQVQGHELDLDLAQYRSNSIWPHSCPGSDAGKANPDREN